MRPHHRSRADAGAAPTEGLSKSEQKRRAKQAEKEKAAAEKAAAKAAAATNAPDKPKKDAGPALEEDEEIDPSKYYDNRLNWVNGLKAAGANPYPHKFNSTMQLPVFHAKYGSVEPGGFADSVEGVAGRIMSKRAGGKGLVFFDVHADGLKLQVRIS